MGSKEKILKAALRVFLEKGYDRTTVNDVAKESKFTKGGLYHHFRNKEHLFVETINFLFNEFERWETEIYTKSLSFKEILRIYFLSLCEVINFIKQVAETDKLEEYNFYELLTIEPNLPDVQIDPVEHPSCYLMTGGTTGVPKACVLTHYNLLALIQQVSGRFGDKHPNIHVKAFESDMKRDEEDGESKKEMSKEETIRTRRAMATAMDKDYETMAKLYNGPAYKKYNYHIKLEEAYKKLTNG